MYYRHTTILSISFAFDILTHSILPYLHIREPSALRLNLPLFRQYLSSPLHPISKDPFRATRILWPLSTSILNTHDQTVYYLLGSNFTPMAFEHRRQGYPWYSPTLIFYLPPRLCYQEATTFLYYYWEVIIIEDAIYLIHTWRMLLTLKGRFQQKIFFGQR